MVVGVDWRVEVTEENDSCVLLSKHVYQHSSALVGGKIIVHGGFSMSIGRLGILYILDLTTKAWQNIPVTTGPRSFHAIVLVDDKIYIHGGGSEKKMEQLDIVTHEMGNVMERYIGVSEKSTRCWGHTLEFYEPERVLLMFGGDANTHCALSYKVDSRIWEKLNATGVPPVNREMHASCMVGDCMYIYGGCATGQDPHELNDLSVLTMRPCPSWSTLVEQHGMGRVGASLSHVGGMLVVYGGGPNDGGLALPKSECLLVFNIMSENPCPQSEEAVLNEASQSHVHHSAIVHGDEIVIIGGVNRFSNTSFPLRSISWLSLSC